MTTFSFCGVGKIVIYRNEDNIKPVLSLELLLISLLWFLWWPTYEHFLWRSAALEGLPFKIRNRVRHCFPGFKTDFCNGQKRKREILDCIFRVHIPHDSWGRKEIVTSRVKTNWKPGEWTFSRFEYRHNSFRQEFRVTLWKVSSKLVQNKGRGSIFDLLICILDNFFISSIFEDLATHKRSECWGHVGDRGITWGVYSQKLLITFDRL